MTSENGASLTAVILAAGRGARLERETDTRPKCLVEIGQQPLLNIQLKMLKAAGIEDILVVAGYHSDQVIQAANGTASVLCNRDWDTSNSLYSLSLTRERVKGALLLINGDVLVHPEALGRLLRSDGDTFIYDSSSGTDEEHMKVQMDGDYLRAMSKHLPADHIHGENLGLLYFTHRTAALLFAEAVALLEDGGRSAWAPAAVERAARKSPIRGIDVSDLPWIEIDFPEDLERARQHVWPHMRPALRANGAEVGLAQDEWREAESSAGTG